MRQFSPILLQNKHAPSSLLPNHVLFTRTLHSECQTVAGSYHHLSRHSLLCPQFAQCECLSKPHRLSTVCPFHRAPNHISPFDKNAVATNEAVVTMMEKSGASNDDRELGRPLCLACPTLRVTSCVGRRRRRSQFLTNPQSSQNIYTLTPKLLLEHSPVCRLIELRAKWAEVGGLCRLE